MFLWLRLIVDIAIAHHLKDGQSCHRVASLRTNHLVDISFVKDNECDGLIRPLFNKLHVYNKLDTMFLKLKHFERLDKLLYRNATRITRHRVHVLLV